MAGRQHQIQISKDVVTPRPIRGRLRKHLSKSMRIYRGLKWPRILGPVAWLEEVCSE